jgi:hypothetical protein
VPGLCQLLGKQERCGSKLRGAVSGRKVSVRPERRIFCFLFLTEMEMPASPIPKPKSLVHKIALH